MVGEVFSLSTANADTDLSSVMVILKRATNKLSTDAPEYINKLIQANDVCM